MAVRLGRVGCGPMAQEVHIPNLASLPGCEWIAVAANRMAHGQSAR